MKIFISVYLLLCSLNLTAQSITKYNFGFEKIDNNSLPEGWIYDGAYDFFPDRNAYKGNYALKIVPNKEGSFGRFVYKIPVSCKVKYITLKAHINIQELNTGFVGLILSLKGKGGILAYTSIHEDSFKVKRGWQEYSITLDYPKGADEIQIKGILKGNSIALFDNFQLFLDGKKFEKIDKCPQKKYLASLDKSFDEGSKVSLNKLSKDEIKHLALLGKIWGFLKYFHPSIANGNFNWDYELFRFIPKYMSAPDVNKEQLIYEWINSFGKVKKCKTCNDLSDEDNISSNLSWINTLDPKVQEQLLKIYNNRAQGNNYYIQFGAPTINPLFINEEAYPDMVFPDDGFRLLALFRFWNCIQYFSPHRERDENLWDEVLLSYIPILLEAKDEMAYEKAILSLLAKLKDSQADIYIGGNKINLWKGISFSPVKAEFIEDKPVVVDFYDSAYQKNISLKIGDVITKINDRTVQEIVQERINYYPASSTASRLNKIALDILRSSNSWFTQKIHYQSMDSTESREELEFTTFNKVRQYYVNQHNRTSYQLIEDNIGYISLYSLKTNDMYAIKDNFNLTDGVIIDLRNTPQNINTFEFAKYFHSLNTSIAFLNTVDPKKYGSFYFSDTLKIAPSSNPYKNRLVVLINEKTQSTFEYVAMALQARQNTTLIGSNTAGSAGLTTSLWLPGGLKIWFSTQGVYYPNGDPIQQVGIAPDIYIEPTIKGVRDGRDELLEKAIELIKMDE